MINYRLAFLFSLLVMTVTVCAEESAELTREEKITAAAKAHRLQLDFDGSTFSGPGWDRLVKEGATAQFFLLGEEHGIAENPKLAAQLFSVLSGQGYSKLVIEISPSMASLIDSTLVAGGLDGLRALFAEPGGEPAFFGMKEEAEMLATVREAAPAGEPVLWGTDYEAGSDRQLIKMLQAADKPETAEIALERLASASDAAWSEWEKSGSPQFIFSFSGDPALVGAVRETWPKPDPHSAIILNTLEKTLTINQLWAQGKAWESNAARAALQRENFLRYWNDEARQGRSPKVMAKFGASHMIRGLSQTAVFDIGTLIPEIAAIAGGHSFSLAVMPGAGAKIAGLNPTNWTFEPRPSEGGYVKDIQPLMDAAFENKFTLIDLSAVRSVVGMNRGQLPDEMFRVIHGFDMLLIMSGSTPSGEFEHD